LRVYLGDELCGRSMDSFDACSLPGLCSLTLLRSCSFLSIVISESSEVSTFCFVLLELSFASSLLKSEDGLFSMAVPSVSCELRVPTMLSLSPSDVPTIDFSRSSSVRRKKVVGPLEGPGLVCSTKLDLRGREEYVSNPTGGLIFGMRSTYTLDIGSLLPRSRSSYSR
jgi:hypothetical protein